MNQIFSEFPKDIRRLLWNSYLNELDRYVIFSAFLPKSRRKFDRHFTKFAAIYGDICTIANLTRYGYVNIEILYDFAKFGRIDLFRWSCLDLYVVTANILGKCVELAIENQKFDLLIWMCTTHIINVDIEYVYDCLNQKGYRSIVRTIALKRLR